MGGFFDHGIYDPIFTSDKSRVKRWSGGVQPSVLNVGRGLRRLALLTSGLYWAVVCSWAAWAYLSTVRTETTPEYEGMAAMTSVTPPSPAELDAMARTDALHAAGVILVAALVIFSAAAGLLWALSWVARGFRPSAA